ncbi:AGAP001416-PA-like protein [Anopheles sinensis]|uniref:AGAP001416-PA-like protein n=1 Tax=Anopheles sinensis TaxID=74873 RepID=A0A084W587_ANOSI|nr:AGAP001416-PA-like protein [Anopheles sinensis]
MNLDATLDSAEEARFLSKMGGLVKRLARSGGALARFSQRELELVLVLYYKLLKADPDGAGGLVSRQQLTTVLDTAFGITDTATVRRIHAALDGGTSAHVTPETWARLVALFVRGSLEERIRHCYAVYDTQRDGLIRRDQLMVLLRGCVRQEEGVEEAVKDLVDIVTTRLDLDRDGAISFEDFRQSVLQEPLLLECLGQALPDRRHVEAFAMTFLVSREV